MSVEASIHAALEAHLRAFAEPRQIRVARQGFAFAPPRDAAYLRVSFLPNATTSPWTAFDDPSQFQGIFQITVVAPANQGVLPFIALASDVADHFGRGVRVPSSAPILTIEERPSIAAPIQDASSMQIPVSVRYRLSSKG